MIDDSALGCPLIYNKHFRPFVDWKKVEEILENNGVLTYKTKNTVVS